METNQVCVSEARQLGRLNVQVLERLGGRVNFLVDELALNLVGRRDGPPQRAVEQARQRLEHHLGQVDVPVLLHDLLVNELRHLRHAILPRAVQLKRLRRRAVVGDHGLQAGCNINHLFFIKRTD